MKFLAGLRERNVTVRILTNSLASTDMSIVHSGYQAFREPLLEKASLCTKCGRSRASRTFGTTS